MKVSLYGLKGIQSLRKKETLPPYLSSSFATLSIKTTSAVRNFIAREKQHSAFQPFSCQNITIGILITV